MPSLCILTDSTVQFTKPVFPGHTLVKIIPSQTQSELAQPNSKFKASSPLFSSNKIQISKIFYPGVDEFRQQFISLAHEYNEVIVLLHSSHLSPLFSYAHEAAMLVRGQVVVRMIETQTTSIGLGFLVQLAADAALRNANSIEIERLLRTAIPHIYSVFCIPELSYLSRSGFIDYAQAYAGEMLGMLPIFSLEEGLLTSLEKVHNYHHLFDFFQEFLDEFSSLHHISIIQSIPAIVREGQTFREYVQFKFQGTPFTEHPINSSLATIFGPHSLGVFAIEIPNIK